MYMHNQQLLLITGLNFVFFKPLLISFCLHFSGSSLSQYRSTNGSFGKSSAASLRCSMLRLARWDLGVICPASQKSGHAKFQLGLRMWGDCYNSNLIFVGAITPEYTICTWSSVLNVGFKNFLIRIIRVLERTILMRIEARVARVALKKLNTFINLLKEPFHRRGFGFFVLFTAI